MERVRFALHASGGFALKRATTFPARLQAAIGDLSVRAFARRAGVSDTFLRQCLSGRTEPTRTKLLALAEAAGTTVQWLATGDVVPGDSETMDRQLGDNASGPLRVAEPAPLDEARLANLIEHVEALAAESEALLSPAHKARLIAELYAQYADTDSAVISRAAVHGFISARLS